MYVIRDSEEGFDGGGAGVCIGVCSRGSGGGGLVFQAEGLVVAAAEREDMSSALFFEVPRKSLSR